MNDLTQHLNWEVEQKQLLLPDSRLSTSYALTRSDNGRILSVRSERYHPVYNRDMESIRQRITERSGLQFKGYQEFQYGKRLMAVPDDEVVLYRLVTKGEVFVRVFVESQEALAVLKFLVALELQAAVLRDPLPDGFHVAIIHRMIAFRT